MEEPLSPEVPPSHRQLFCVTGSTALDNLAKQDITEHLLNKGIRVVTESLLAAGVGQELAAVLETSSTVPCWIALVEHEESDLDQALKQLFSPGQDGNPSYLVGKYGHCFGGTADEGAIDKLFPTAIHDPDTSLTASSESAITPENEKRVFTFDNDPVVIEEEEVLDDDVAGELPMIPKTPEPRSRLSFSSAGRRSSMDGNGSKSQLDQSRPASAGSASVPGFKARPAPTGTPSITPRLTKSAALRLGLKLPERTRATPRASVSTASDVAPAALLKTPMGPLKSLAQPSITPRLNKASAARLDKDKDTSGPVLKVTVARRQSYSTSERSKGYEGMAGFGGRRLSVQPSAAPQPKILPKQTKASSLRSSTTLEGVLPPLPSTTTRRQSYSTAERAALFGSVSASSTDGGRRISIASLQAPLSMPKGNKASLLRNGGGAKVINTSTSTNGGGHSRTSTNGSSTMSQSSFLSPSPASAPVRSPSAISNHSQPTRPTSGQASHDAPLKVKKPAIVPRVNKAAELRMAARNAQKA